MCCIQHGAAAAAAALEEAAPFCMCSAAALRFDGSHIHASFMRLYMCVCVRCQGHWQKAEVLLGSDFSFLFASAAMPFRVRAFCAEPSV